MFAPLLLMISAAAPGQESQTTAADVGRCINSAVEKLSGSNESAALIADRAVAACEDLIGQWSAARDALVASEAGPVSPANSADFRKTATEDFRQSAMLYAERVRQIR